MAHTPLDPRRMRLEKKTREIAQPRERDKARRDFVTTILFHSGGHFWALETRHAQGTFALEQLMPLPGAPAFVLGLANHRGTIRPILDLMAALGGTEPMTEPPEWAVLAGQVDHGLALAVDHSPSVLTLDREEVLRLSDDLSPIATEFIQGKTHDGIFLLNAERLVEDPRWVIRENSGLFQ